MKYFFVSIMVISLLVATTCVAQNKVVLQLNNPSILSCSFQANSQRILFPLELPAELTNVTIDYAKLTLTVDTTSFASSVKAVGIALFPMTTQWDANSSWSSAWDSPGAYYAESYGQFMMTSTAKNGVIEFQLAEIVQSWVDGTLPNFGFVLRSSLEGQQDLSLSDETGSATLTIYYTKRD